MLWWTTAADKKVSLSRLSFVWTSSHFNMSYPKCFCAHGIFGRSRGEHDLWSVSNSLSQYWGKHQERFCRSFIFLSMRYFDIRPIIRTGLPILERHQVMSRFLGAHLILIYCSLRTVLLRKEALALTSILIDLRRMWIRRVNETFIVELPSSME